MPRPARRLLGAFVISVAVLVGACGHPVTSSRVNSGGAGKRIPGISGTVTGVPGGKIVLSDVQISRVPGETAPSHIPVPPGRWITPDHWQSDGDTLDLFRGEDVLYAPRGWPLMPIGHSMHFFDGIVSAVAGDRVTFTTITVTMHAGLEQWNHPTGTVSLRIPPYSWQRIYMDITPLKTITVGDKGIIDWFGTTDDKLVWGIGFLSEASLHPTKSPPIHCPSGVTIQVLRNELSRGDAALCRAYRHHETPSAGGA